MAKAPFRGASLGKFRNLDPSAILRILRPQSMTCEWTMRAAEPLALGSSVTPLEPIGASLTLPVIVHTTQNVRVNPSAATLAPCPLID